MAERVARSLCSGIGGAAAAVEINGIAAAYRPPGRPQRRAPVWRPAFLPNDVSVLFHGWLDNADELRSLLGSDTIDEARLYGEAVVRWGDEADRHVVGEYCSVVADVPNRRLRLARSPFRAPPLFHHHDPAVAIVGSVPRIFFAAGLPRTLNEQRVVDSALMNLTDHEGTYFEGIRRVPLGALVVLEPGQPRRLVRYYDPLAIVQREVGDEEALRRVDELLDEAVRVCLQGSSAPGVTLSGGLDSPQVALRALKALPAEQDLPTFTFIPEQGFDGITEPGFIGNERDLVERFAAMHPRLRPHFTANEGYGHDHRLADIFHVMGGAPAGLTNMYVFHGIFSAASAAGCDRLLIAEWGNYAFSDKGMWGYVEYLRTGRWRQLVKALRAIGGRPRPLWWRFAAQSVMPLLPDWAWTRIRRRILGPEHDILEVWQPFTPRFRERSGVDARRPQGKAFGRNQPRNALQARAMLFDSDDAETAEVYQAFEQLYGIVQRDPFAYRPLVEYIWSLPTRMFMRDGKVRWLAKELAKGLMPEEQRANRLNGRWDADWHLRIGRRRTEYLAELDRLEADERFAGMFDVPRLRAVLEDWPERTPRDEHRICTVEFALPHALLAARFINYVEGRNQH